MRAIPLQPSRFQPFFVLRQRLLAWADGWRARLAAPATPSAASAQSIVVPLGAAQTLPPRGGLRLEVLAGHVWLTEPGDPEDHFLVAGQARCLGPGPVVLQNHGRVPLALRLVMDPQAEAPPRHRELARRVAASLARSQWGPVAD